jgi:hypothetical protein
MMKRMLIALALMAVPAALAAQESAPAEQASERLSVAAGETVTARIVDGRFLVTARARGEASGDVPEGTVRFSMTGGGMTMLQVENGTGRAFEYRARMFRGRRSAATSTCTVLPGIAGFEQWPGNLDRLELSSPELLTGSTSGIRCR